MSGIELREMSYEVTVIPEEVPSAAVVAIPDEYGYDTKDDYPDGGWRAYSVVLGSFIGFIASFGQLNSIGAIQTYLATHQLKDTLASTTSWIFSIYLALSLAICIVVGPIFDKKGSFGLLIGGSLLMLGGFMGLASSSKLYQFILSLSLCIATGNALSITPLVGVINHWFLKKRGSALSIATNGGSLGGIVIPLLLRWLYPKVGYAWAIRTLGFLCFGCLAIAAFLAKDRINSLENVNKRAYTRAGEEPSLSFFDFKAFKDWKLSFLTAGTFLAELSLLSITTYFPTYAIAYGMEESESYILLTVFGATGMLGKIFSGYLSDTIGPFNVMISMLVGVIVSIFLIWLPFGADPKALYAFAAFCGFFSSSIFSLTPVCLASITKTDKFGQRYGSMYFIVSMGNLFGIPLGAAIIGDGSQRNYRLFSMMCGLLTVTGTVCWTISRYYLVGMKLNVKV